MSVTISNHYLNEAGASLMYLVASNKFQLLGYNGIASYCLKLSEEEAGHSRLVSKYCNERGIPLECAPVVQPELCEDLVGMFSDFYDAELFVMECLTTLMSESDEAQKAFIIDMVKEQIGGVNEARINLLKAKIAVESMDTLGFDSYCASL